MERPIIKRIFTYELCQSYRVPVQVDGKTLSGIKHGEVIAVVKGQEAVRAVLRLYGTDLVTGVYGEIQCTSFPEGWGYQIVGMENHYEDGTVELP